MKNQIYKNMIWNAVGSVIYLASQWLITVLVTRLFGYNDAGILSLAMSLSSTFQTIAFFGIRNYQVSDINDKYSDNCYVMLRNITCFIALILCVIFSLINNYSLEQLSAILLFMFFRLAEDYSDVLYGVIQKKDRLDIAGKGFALKGTSTFLAFIIVYYLGGTLNLCLAGMAITSWLTTLFFDLLVIKRMCKFKMTDKMMNALLLAKETFPLCIYLFLSAAVTVIPKYILEKITDPATLGAYSSIFAPAIIIHAISIYIYSPFIGKFAFFWEQKKHNNFLNLAFKIFIIVLGIGLIMVIVGELFGAIGLQIIFGESILQYSDMLLPILFATITMAIASFIYMLEVVIRDFSNLIISCSIGCILALILTPVMVNYFGANGTSYTIVICEITSIAYMTYSIILKSHRITKGLEKNKYD